MRILNNSGALVTVRLSNGAAFAIAGGSYAPRDDSDFQYLAGVAATLALFTSGVCTLLNTDGRPWTGPALPTSTPAPSTPSYTQTLTPGVPVTVGAIVRMRVRGTGTVSVDGVTPDGTVVSLMSAKTYTNALGLQPELIYAGPCVQLRALFPTTMQVEVF